LHAVGRKPRRQQQCVIQVRIGISALAGKAQYRAVQQRMRTTSIEAFRFTRSIARERPVRERSRGRMAIAGRVIVGQVIRQPLRHGAGQRVPAIVDVRHQPRAIGKVGTVIDQRRIFLQIARNACHGLVRCRRIGMLEHYDAEVADRPGATRKRDAPAFCEHAAGAQVEAAVFLATRNAPTRGDHHTRRDERARTFAIGAAPVGHLRRNEWCRGDRRRRGDGDSHEARQNRGNQRVTMAKSHNDASPVVLAEVSHLAGGAHLIEVKKKPRVVRGFGTSS